MTLTAAWKEVKGSIEETAERRAVAALAASVALPSLDTESASQLAETEGLVTHLTSLVLVDEAGAVQDGIPAARKVALPAPRLIAMSLMAPTQSRNKEFLARVARSNDGRGFRRNLDYNASDPIDPGSPVDLSSLGAEIDWDLRLINCKPVTFRRSTEMLRERSKLRRPSPKLSSLPDSSPSIRSLWSSG